jgi:uncharacterized protein (DUF488 family)
MSYCGPQSPPGPQCYMNEKNIEKEIWTIGHSTRSMDEFLTILHSFSISMLVDIRNFPGSKRYPHFNKEAMQVSLPAGGINYFHMKELGGRRQPLPGSLNTAWRNAAFRGYADYMETEVFKEAIEKLERIALKERTAYMCSEAVWWSCHRALLSDRLKLAGWKVWHIMNTAKATEHPFTAPARIVNGQLLYHDPGLF